MGAFGNSVVGASVSFLPVLLSVSLVTVIETLNPHGRELFCDSHIVCVTGSGIDSGILQVVHIAVS